MRNLVGHWDASGFEFSIVGQDDAVLLRYPEAPDGYESALVDLGNGRVSVGSGPFGGAEIVFSTDPEPSHGLVGDRIPVTRLSRPAAAPAGSGLVAPSRELTAEDECRFRDLWAETEASPDGRIIDSGPGPLHGFVQWLSARNLVIFHGSNRSDIEEFRPVRTSMEINDQSGRGNLGAVYGTHDGLWAMFFSVIDRAGMTGSIRNGFGRFERRSDGADLDLYHFSVNQETLDRGPFTTGYLYLMPREDFRRLPYYPGGPMTNEWACERSVRPLARLAVQPSDFPFRDRLGVHDDGPILELQRLADRVHDAIVWARPIEEGFSVLTEADPAAVDSYISMAAEFFPDVSRVAWSQDDGTRIDMTGPAAFVSAMERRLAAFLSDAGGVPGRD